MDIAELVNELFGVEVQNVQEADAINEGEESPELLAREAAAGLLEGDDDAPLYVVETATGFAVVGTTQAVHMGDDGSVDVKELGERRAKRMKGAQLSKMRRSRKTQTAKEKKRNIKARKKYKKNRFKIARLRKKVKPSGRRRMAAGDETGVCDLIDVEDSYYEEFTDLLDSFEVEYDVNEYGQITIESEAADEFFEFLEDDEDIEFDEDDLDEAWGDKAHAKKMLSKGYTHILILPKGMGDPLYAKNYGAAVEMTKEYGKGTRAVALEQYINEDEDDLDEMGDEQMYMHYLGKAKTMKVTDKSRLIPKAKVKVASEDAIYNAMRHGVNDLKSAAKVAEQMMEYGAKKTLVLKAFGKLVGRNESDVVVKFPKPSAKEFLRLANRAKLSEATSVSTRGDYMYAVLPESVAKALQMFFEAEYESLDTTKEKYLIEAVISGFNFAKCERREQIDEFVRSTPWATKKMVAGVWRSMQEADVIRDGEDKGHYVLNEDVVEDFLKAPDAGKPKKPYDVGPGSMDHGKPQFSQEPDAPRKKKPLEASIVTAVLGEALLGKLGQAQVKQIQDLTPGELKLVGRMLQGKSVQQARKLLVYTLGEAVEGDGDGEDDRSDFSVAEAGKKIPPGLLKWVEDYKVARKAGAVKVAKGLRNDINKEIRRLKLDKDKVYGTKAYMAAKSAEKGWSEDAPETDTVSVKFPKSKVREFLELAGKLELPADVKLESHGDKMTVELDYETSTALHEFFHGEGVEYTGLDEGKQKRLQVRKDGKWEYVFARNTDTGGITTTKNPKKALGVRDLEVFQSKFANHEFRVAESLDEDLRLTPKSKSVIRAFTDKKAADSKKLTTDGETLDGNWIGGRDIAHWEGSKIRLVYAGGRAAQTVHRAIRKEAPKNDIAEDLDEAKKPSADVGGTLKLKGKKPLKLPAGTSVQWSPVNQAWLVLFGKGAVRTRSVLRTISDPDELYDYLHSDLKAKTEAIVDPAILLTKFKKGDKVVVKGESKTVKRVGKVGGRPTLHFTDGSSVDLSRIPAKKESCGDPIVGDKKDAIDLLGCYEEKDSAVYKVGSHWLAGKGVPMQDIARALEELAERNASGRSTVASMNTEAKLTQMVEGDYLDEDKMVKSPGEKVAFELLDYHGGGSTAVYITGSAWIAKKPVPAKTVRRAYAEMKKFSKGEHGDAMSKKLTAMLKKMSESEDLDEATKPEQHLSWWKKAYAWFNKEYPELAKPIKDVPAKSKHGLGGFDWGTRSLKVIKGVGLTVTGGLHTANYYDYFILKNAPVSNPPVKRPRKPAGYDEWLARQENLSEDDLDDYVGMMAESDDGLTEDDKITVTCAKSDVKKVIEALKAYGATDEANVVVEGDTVEITVDKDIGEAVNNLLQN